MRKLIVFVETFALTAVTVTVITMNPQTAQMMASQAANGPQESVIGRIIAFAQAAGTVAMLTVLRRASMVLMGRVTKYRIKIRFSNPERKCHRDFTNDD
jgi:hypothetical protein